MKKAWSLSLRVALWLLLVLLSVWATAALYFAFPFSALRLPAAAVLLLVILAVCTGVKKRPLAVALIVGVFALVLGCWLTLRPSNDRVWQTDVARTAFAEINGDNVVLHNVRNFDYRTEKDYTPKWETRTIRLSDMTGMDFYLIHWGSPWIAHTIVSFPFADSRPIAFSIETRLESDEAYSALAGFFRRYELIYVVADERDVIRLRTNYRKDEDVYLYHLKGKPERAREIFLDYLRTVNELHARPQFYNALTSNCTTNIRLHVNGTAHGTPLRWGWQLLLNGKLDERAYELGTLDRTLPFPELKRRSLINPVARAANDAPDFSQKIRAGRPGF